MMIDLLTDILKSQKEIDDWKIIERKIDGRELFFVKKALDMNRAKNVHKFFVTIYHDFKENEKNYRGSSEFEIHPGMDKFEIEETVKENLNTTKFIKNEPYPISTPVASKKHDAVKSSYSKGDLSEWIVKIADTFYSKDEKNSWINSSECFLNHVEERIINSKEVDVSNDLYRLYIEFVTTSKSGKEDVELYGSNVELSDFDPDMIKKDVTDALFATEERARAVHTPPLKDIKVILTGDSVKAFFSYYLYRTSSRYIYEHLSDAKIGQNVQKYVGGDKITMWIDPYLPKSAYSMNYDHDGFDLKKIKIIDNSIVNSIWGDVRYAYYLGMEPTGYLTNFFVEPGETSCNEIESGGYLKIAAFSDFEMDPMTGDFGGEIRLGWYSDGKKVMPVTGGSISANVHDVEHEIIMSKEMRMISNFKGPEEVKISNVKISS